MIKDINLVSAENGTLDWSFSNNDVNIVIGNAQLISAVKHAVLLKQYELEQEIYMNKGCEAYNYLKTKNDANTRTYIEQSIISTCTEIKGVKNAEVKLNTTANNIEIMSLTITNDNGVQVVVI